MIIYAPAPPNFPADENAFLALFFASRPGTFIEIGAHTGLHYSNTRPLWERGWSGVLIEPDPASFAALRSLYDGDPRIRLLNLAVSTSDGTARFAQHTDPTRTGWHSLSPSWIATWEPGAARFINVPTRSLPSLLASGDLPRQCDLLSVDTEGLDADIIESMPDDFRPRCIICEMDKHKVRERIDGCLERRHYRFVWGNYLNSIYVDAAAATAAAP